METYKHNNQEAIKNAKSEVKEHKTEKERILKRMKMLEMKLGGLQENNISLEKNNNNLQSNTSSCLRGNEASIPISTTNLVESTLISDVSSERKTSSFSSEVSNSEVAIATSLTAFNTQTTRPSSTSSPTSPDKSCEHKPQCVVRQPKPPPVDKCSILVHNGSKYHEHFLTSVPARYGPHDNCMAVSYENYGCSDCIWFKKWGELHGYPDLWPLKYIESGTYSDHLGN